MGLKFVHSKWYKSSMGFVYGWGACAVIIGALFKIMHFPGASYILSGGMIVEALIFFLSAFEPETEKYKWSNVFPELTDELSDVSGGEVKTRNVGVSSSMEMDIIDKESSEKIKEGLNKLAKTVENINDISDAAIVTNKYKESMILASDAMGKSANASEKLESSINSFGDNLVAVGSDFSTKVSSRIEGFSEAIDKSLKSINVISSSVDSYSNFVQDFEKTYSSNVGKLNGSISSLNAIYEVQIKSTNDYVNSFNSLHREVKDVLSNVSNTSESAKLYKEQSELLGKNISNLNNVYGSMLSVFNNVKK